MLGGLREEAGVILSVIIAISLMPWVVPSVSAQSTHSLGDTGDITVTLEAGQYGISQVGEYSLIEMEGFGSAITPGEPKLPSKTFLIGLPPGAEAVSIDMVTSDYAELPGEYRIMPAPPIVSGQENGKVKRGEDEEIYSSEGPYPSSPYEYLGMGQMRKYYFAGVRFCPIAYYPASNKLGLYRSITLKIKYEISQAVPPELLSDTVMDDVASQIIFNYASMKSKYQSAAAASPVSYNYVIITTESLQSAVEPMVTWKTTIGYSVNVLTTGWISSNYSGRDLPEKIRNFLIDKYAEWGIEYVLIVGSHSTIPMRYCYPDPSDHDPNSDSTTPTDYYYADLSGNWDLDGDGYFGEYGQDNISYHPEVYVGRIPFDDAATVTSICQKSVSFEQDSGDWKKKALLLGAIANYGGEDHEWNAWRTDGAVLMEECWDDILKDNGYSRERMYEKEGLSPSTYACDHPLTNSNVLNTSYGWPSGYGIVNWGAHGGQTGASRKVWSWDDGDGTPESAEMGWYRFISSGDAGSLDDSKPAIVFSCSCLTAYPEYAGNLGNSLLQQGAVAFVGATRPTWYVCGWDNGWLFSGGSSSIDYHFFQYLVNQGEACGDALYNAQVHLYDAYSFPDWRDSQNMFSFCLYGEPSLGTATVSMPPDISIHPSSFDVMLPPNTTCHDTMEIGNEGGTTLTYALREATPNELVYDDGECDSWGWMGDVDEHHDFRRAVRFTPPSYPVYLDTASLCLAPNSPDFDHEEFAVEVYDDDGASGAPGSLLGMVYTTPSSWGWWGVDISELGIAITSGDLYIAYRQLTYAPDCEALCDDNSEPHYYRSWDKSWVGEQPWTPAGTGPGGTIPNYMIRSVVDVLGDCLWLDESPKSGSVGPGDLDSITITIDTTGLTKGDYSGVIVISSNDSDKPEVTVLVTLHVSVANNPPQLSNPSVQPPSGPPSTDFYYYVNYYDSDGDSPSVRRVYVDGTPYTMSLQSGSVSNGVYRYGPKNLSAGSHNYYFYFGDGKGGADRLPTSGTYSGPSVSTPNQPPTLSSGYVTPSSGDTSTTFNYYVTYTDSDGDAPTTKYVYVDGSPHTMTKISGDYTSGATFKYSTALSAGSHNYYFYFNDGRGGTARLPASGSYSGPSVSGAGAATATRDLPAAVELGANFDVSIEASGCGFAGQVVETLPAGFTYVSCTLEDIRVQVEDSVVRFAFVGDAASFTYTVTAPTVEGNYTFTGILRDGDLNEFAVGGDTEITVGWDPWVYDENNDGKIQKMEAIHAVQDYFSRMITKVQAIEVVMLYFRQRKD